MISISKKVRKRENLIWESIAKRGGGNFLYIELAEAILPMLVVMDIRQLTVDSLIDSIKGTYDYSKV